MENNDRKEPTNNYNGQPQNVIVEKPLLNDDTRHVNGKYADPEEDEDEAEDDLVLGDEDELEGDEMEFEVILEEDLDQDDISEDDLVLDTSDDPEDDEDDDL
jgi:hypothetical protein